MNINPKDIVAGFPILEVRNMFQHRGLIGYVYPDDTRYIASIDEHPDEDVDELFKELVARGWLDEPTGVEPYANGYEMTTAGHAFRQASARKPFKRATAQKALDDMLARAAEINANHLSLFRIDEIILYGSMLDESRETVGDVDLALRMTRKRESTKAEMNSIFGRGMFRRRAPRPDEPFDHWDIPKMLRKGSAVLNINEEVDRFVGGLLAEGQAKVIWRGTDPGTVPSSP